MKVKVTAKDIRLGKKESDTPCPVARALRRNDGCKRWQVGATEIRNSKGWVVMYLSIAARQFVSRFDAGKPVKPFTFELKLK